MPNPTPAAGRRGTPADLTPEQRARYDALRLQARVDVETGAVGPPADPDPAGNPSPPNSAGSPRPSGRPGRRPG